MYMQLEVRHPTSEEEESLPVSILPQQLTDTQITKTITVWSGTVTLPEPRGARRFRLVIEEYEILRAGNTAEENAISSMYSGPRSLDS